MEDRPGTALDVLAIGETLVDLISVEQTDWLGNATTFRRCLGGSPANTAVNVAKLGGESAVVSKTGIGAFAQFIKSELQRHCVSVDYLVMDHRHRTTVAFVSSTTGRPDFEIACSGDEPSYTGVIGCGRFTRVLGVTPSDGVMRMTFGKRGFFGYQVTPSGEIFWFQNPVRSEEPDRDELGAVSDEELLGAHRHDHEPIAGIIRSTEGRIGRFPIYDIPSLPAWHRGSVCLIGDAAHATSPHAGQGASTALEDPSCSPGACATSRTRREPSPPSSAFARTGWKGSSRAPGGPAKGRPRPTSSPAACATSCCRFFSRSGSRKPSGSTRTGWTGTRRWRRHGPTKRGSRLRR